MSKKKMFMKTFGLQPLNLFIGGVSGSITSATDLALLLEKYPSNTPFLASEINYFTINGSEISARITTDYQIKDDGFSGNTDITYFIDTENRLKYLKTNSFKNASNLSKLDIKGVLRVGLNAFYSTPFLRNIILPNAQIINNAAFSVSLIKKRYFLPSVLNLGISVDLNDAVFVSANYFDATFYLPLFLQTVNSGAPDYDITVRPNPNYRYISNTSSPDAVSDLSVDTVYDKSIRLNWTPPASTNTIEYYEIYVNGEFLRDSFCLDYAVITGLTNLSSYTFNVVAVDIYYNKSPLSNIVTQTINGASIFRTENILDSFNFNNNTDSQSSLNLITRLSPCVYTAGKTESALDVGAVVLSLFLNTNYHFSNGTNDLPFSIVELIKFDSLSNCTIFEKRTSISNFEYQLAINSGVFYFDLYDRVSASYLRAHFTASTYLNTLDFFSIICTYDGSGSTSGMNIYINGSLITTTKTTIGTYTRMRDNGSAVRIGGSLGYLNAKMDSLAIFDVELNSTEASNINSLFNSGYKLL